MTNWLWPSVACLMLAGWTAGCSMPAPTPEATAEPGRGEAASTDGSVRPGPQPGRDPEPAPDGVAAQESGDAKVREAAATKLVQGGGAAGVKVSSAEADAVAAIVKIGGKVHPLKNNPRPGSVSLDGLELGDRDLEPLTMLSTVTALGMSKSKLSPGTLVPVGRLGGLTTLFLGHAKFLPETIKPVSGLKGLTFLDLFGTPLTDEGLDNVKGLTELQTLNIGGTGVTDAGLDRLKGLTKLETLNLAATKVTDEGMGRLTGLTRLKSVNAPGTKVTPAGVIRLERAVPGVFVYIFPN